MYPLEVCNSSLKFVRGVVHVVVVGYIVVHYCLRFVIAVVHVVVGYIVVHYSLRFVIAVVHVVVWLVIMLTITV